MDLDNTMLEILKEKLRLSHLDQPGGNFITVEGNIGVGKSTICHAMAERYKGVTLQEPVDKPMFRNLLGKYYTAPNRWGFSFQMYLLKERLNQHTLAVELAAQGVTVVQDRAIYSDGCFGRLVHADGNMTDEEWEIYSDTFGSMKRHLRYPDAMVYLRAAPEVCFERIKSRARTEEAGVPLDYLKRLHDQHEELAEAMSRYTRVLIFDWNEFSETEKVCDAVDECLKEPRLFMRNFTKL